MDNYKKKQKLFSFQQSFKYKNYGSTNQTNLWQTIYVNYFREILEHKMHFRELQIRMNFIKNFAPSLEHKFSYMNIKSFLEKLSFRPRGPVVEMKKRQGLAGAAMKNRLSVFGDFSAVPKLSSSRKLMRDNLRRTSTKQLTHKGINMDTVEKELMRPPRIKFSTTKELQILKKMFTGINQNNLAEIKEIVSGQIEENDSSKSSEEVKQKEENKRAVMLVQEQKENVVPAFDFSKHLAKEKTVDTERTEKRSTVQQSKPSKNSLNLKRTNVVPRKKDCVWYATQSGN